MHVAHQGPWSRGGKINEGYMSRVALGPYRRVKSCAKRMREKKSEKERDREKGGDVPPLAVLSGWPGIQGSGSLQVPLRPTPKQFPNGANDGD